MTTKRSGYKSHSPAMLTRMLVVWSVAAIVAYAAVTWRGSVDTGLFVVSSFQASALLWLMVAAMSPGAVLFVFMLIHGDQTPSATVWHDPLDSSTVTGHSPLAWNSSHLN